MIYVVDSCRIVLVAAAGRCFLSGMNSLWKVGSGVSEKKELVLELGYFWENRFGFSVRALDRRWHRRTPRSPPKSPPLCSQWRGTLPRRSIYKREVRYFFGFFFFWVFWSLPKFLDRRRHISGLAGARCTAAR